ncbi:DUF2336 domain-containing protein [Thalassospiraceae bacterium LMO-JJ14]|nr:DUF2336 domain-containing protein [Thalassospiraceae bacterium LMO-JJ14]
MARDDEESVRAVLAEKVAGMASGDAHDNKRLEELAHEAMQLLAKDQTVRVRQILSEALREVADAPADVIRRLAWDVETVVAAPVLRSSPVLNDEDLIEIILAKPSPGTVSAVSLRSGVSGNVSDAIVESEDIEAIAMLLGNPSAQIREETLDRLINDAGKIDLWQMPLAMRPKLPSKAAVKIAQVVAEDVLRRMQARKDLSKEATKAVRDIVLKRLGDGIALLPEDDGKKLYGAGGMQPDDASIFDRATHEWAAGTLDETALVRELTKGDMNFAKAILSVMADVPYRSVRRLEATHNVKGCVALSWGAGLSAKTAEIVQEKLGQVKAEDVLREDGGNYPMTDKDMAWQLELLRKV